MTLTVALVLHPQKTGAKLHKKGHATPAPVLPHNKAQESAQPATGSSDTYAALVTVQHVHIETRILPSHTKQNQVACANKNNYATFQTENSDSLYNSKGRNNPA